MDALLLGRCKQVGDANANAERRRVEDPPNKKQKNKKKVHFLYCFLFFLVYNIFFYLFLGSGLLTTRDCDERRA